LYSRDIHTFLVQIIYLFDSRWLSTNLYMWHAFMIIVFLISLFFICWTRLITKQEFGDKEQLRKIGEQTRRILKIKNSIFPHKLFLKGMFNTSNPILEKELREQYGRYYLRIVRSFIFGFVFSVILYFASIPGRSIFLSILDISGYMPLLIILVIPFLTGNYAANCFRYEKDQDTLNLLRATTLPQKKLILGKLHAGFRLFQWKFWAFYGWFFILFFWAYWTCGNEIKNIEHFKRYQKSLWLVFFSIPISYVFAQFILAFGCWISLTSKKTITAYVILFGVIFSQLIGTYIPLILFEGNLSNDIIDKAFYSMISPFFLLQTYFYSSFWSEWLIFFIIHVTVYLTLSWNFMKGSVTKLLELNE
jgi:hypothetical protein